MSVTSIEKKAFAKVNLYLRILGKRADNYHEMFTIMQKIPIFDIVKIDIFTGQYIYPPQINIVCADTAVPSDESNTAYRAARTYFSRISKITDISDYAVNSVNIEIDKRILSQAGLGGGSSDAASVLLALNDFFDNLLTEDMLLDMASEIGADVAFFVKIKDECGAAVCEGTGEIVTPICVSPDLSNARIEVIKPDLGISTREAFEKFDEAHIDNPEVLSMSEAERNYIANVFRYGKIEDIANIMKNDFEKITVLTNEGESVRSAKVVLISRGAVAAQLSGSGSAVFGIFV